MLGDNPPPSCLKTKTENLASQALASCFRFSMLLRQIYDDLVGDRLSVKLLVTECDSSDSSDPPLLLGDLTMYCGGSETLFYLLTVLL